MRDVNEAGRDLDSVARPIVHIGELIVAQKELVARLKAEGDEKAAIAAGTLLNTLVALREKLRRYQDKSGSKPPKP